MARLFISYSGRDNYDREIAAEFDLRLREKGNIVFFDRNLEVGVKWPEEVAEALELCDVFIVLLSEQSVNSEMVREEIRRAHKRNQATQMPQILPIRLSSLDEIPYDVEARLSNLQYLELSEVEDTEKVLAKIDSVIRRIEVTETSAHPDSVISEREESSPPKLEIGAMTPGSPFHVKRKAEKTILSLIEDGSCGAIGVFGPRQFGKTSLLRQMQSVLDRDNHRTVFLDLSLLATEQFSNVKEAYIGLGQLLIEELGLHLDVHTFFNIRGFPSRALLLMLIECVRTSSDSRRKIVLLLDETDAFFKEEFADGFFGGLRFVIDQKASTPELERIVFVFAYAENPDYWLADKHQSPFRGVTQTFQLKEFELDDLRWLNKRHSPEALSSDADVIWVSQYLGGHPALTRLAFFYLSSGLYTIAEIRESKNIDDGIFSDHLRSKLISLYEREELVEPMRRIVAGKPCKDELHFQSLRALGLVMGGSRMDAAPRSELYREYFENKI